MINEEKGKISGATVAIILVATFVLAATLLAIKIANDIKAEKRGLIAEETEIGKKATLGPGAELPRLEDIKGEEYSLEASIKKEPQEEKEPVPEVRLKDLSTKTILAEEKGHKKEVIRKEEQKLKTSPNPQEMKELKRKGLIIF